MRLRSTGWLIFGFTVLCAASSFAGDWPVFRHDSRHSGATGESIAAERLQTAWTWKSAHPPITAWAGPAKWDAYKGIRGLRDMRDYDRAFHTVVVGVSVFFGSSVDDAVYCLDAVTGQRKWVFRADGPVRIAPTVHDGRVYFGSDDGHAYCVAAANGKLIWKFRPPQSAMEPMILQNGRFISKWPCRTGVAVVKGTAYMGFSLLPWQSSWICAVDAKTGTANGAGRFVIERKGMTAEGCLVADDERLIFPQGRVAPHVFRRLDGASLGSLKNGGGSFLATDTDGTIYHGPGNKTGWVNVSQSKTRRLTKTYQVDTEIAMTADRMVRSSDDRVVATHRKTGALIWRTAFSHRSATIIAGDIVFVGGRNEVAALSLDSGRIVWKANVKGTAIGLAVAAGRLFVSTDAGTIQCFQPGREDAVRPPAVARRPTTRKLPSRTSGVSKIDDPSLVGRWVFHSEMNTRARRRGLKNAERRVADLAGGRHATVLGDLRLRMVGGVEALELDGKQTSVRIVDDHKTARLPATNITAEAWVRVDATQQWGGIIGAFQDNGNYERGWILGCTGDKFSFGVAGEKGPGRMTYLSAKSAFQLERWYHVVGTYDGIVQSLFINGELANRSTIQKGPIAYPPQAFYEIGAYHDKDEYFRMTGLLHDVRVFDSAQTPTAIKERYLAERSRFPVPIELDAGPWAQFDSPEMVTIRWRTAKPSPTILRWRAGEQKHRLINNALQTQHAMTAPPMKGQSLYSYAVETEVNGKTGVTPQFELDPHFNFTHVAVRRRGDVFPRNASQSHAAREVDAWLQLTKSQKGVCLVVGCGDGSRIWQLIRKTQFHVIAVETDEQKARRTRDRLTRAGVYGSRVTIQHVPEYSSLPFCGAFANGVVRGSNSPWQSNDIAFLEIMRVLRPSGGTAMFPFSQTAFDTARRLGKSKSVSVSRIKKNGNDWLVLTRGGIVGAGEWSHLYGRADNTAFGGESLGGAKSINDLHVQWIGRPGPRAQADRNGRKPSPLSKNGRLFVQGLQRLIAIDAYNGSVLWSLEIPPLERFNMPRDSSNWCVDDNFVYVAIKNRCWQIDAETGRVVGLHDVRPGAKKAWAYDWSYVARVGSLLVGSGVKKGTAWTNFWGKSGEGWYDDAAGPVTDKICSENLFAVDPATGRTEWSYAHGVVLNSTISAANGRVYFVECRHPKVLASNSRRVGMKELWQQQFLVALDAKSGSKVWEQPLDTADGTTAFWMAAAKERIVIAASGTKNYDVHTFDTTSGKPAWHQRFSWPGGKSDHGKALSRPAIVGDRLIVRPKMFSLKSGKVIAGKVPHGGCGTYAATTNMLIYRNANITMWDATSGKTSGWNRLRPGCWLSTIPAGGMLLSPEAGGGCSCGNWLETSIGFAPKTRDKKTAPKPDVRPKKTKR